MLPLSFRYHQGRWFTIVGHLVVIDGQVQLNEVCTSMTSERRPDVCSFLLLLLYSLATRDVVVSYFLVSVNAVAVCMKWTKRQTGCSNDAPGQRQRV